MSEEKTCEGKGCGECGVYKQPTFHKGEGVANQLFPGFPKDGKIHGVLEVNLPLAANYIISYMSECTNLIKDVELGELNGLGFYATLGETEGDKFPSIFILLRDRSEQ